MGEWKSRNTQVLAAAAGLLSSSRHIATNSARSVVGRLGPAIRQIPFEHQPDLDQQRVGVEGGNGVAELRRQRQNFGQCFAVQRRQHVGRGLITLGDRRGRIAFDKARAAEILGDQESGIEIGVMDRGRREAALAQGRWRWRRTA